MTIRRLTPADMDAAIILMNYYQDEMEVEDWQQDEVVQALRKYSISGEANCLVAMEGNRCVGICVGGLKKEFYNKKMIAYVQLLYLLPTHRDKYNYQNLFNEFAKWFAPLNIKTVILNDILDDNPRMKDIAEKLEFDDIVTKFYIKESV